jgi:hypothetical protein
MSTLTLHTPRRRFVPAALRAFFRRVFSAFGTFVDVWTEAKKMAIEAERRYPFARG